MKRIAVIAMSFFMLQACSNNGGESGAVHDGFKGAGDPNGGLNDTMRNYNPAIDSTVGEDRVDTEKRDSTQQH